MGTQDFFALATVVDAEYGRENGPGSEWLSAFAYKVLEQIAMEKTNE